MADPSESWWRRHALTLIILFTAFALAIVIRSIWTYPIFQQWGWIFVYGGGSDSYYHSRVMQYIVETHTNLIKDPLLRYPVAPINPREPLFDWMNAILGILFQGFFTPSTGQPAAVVAGSYFLNIDSPLWAAIGVFPVYLLGREVSSKRMGLISAMLYPFLVASIESTALGYANYLSFYAFFMLITVYAYVRMIKATGHRKWVTNYRDVRSIPGTIRQMLRYERTGLKWAVFTGVCLGALALAWQGYPFFIAALAAFIAVQMVVERLRRIDSFALYINTWIVGLVGFPMAMPYFYVQGGLQFAGFFEGWFAIPLLVFFGTLLVLLPFLLLRDRPWVFSLPLLIGTAGVALAALDLIDPSSFSTIITGQGYFVKTLVYSTVAEAQAPSFDSLVLGFGILTFFVAFVGLALFGYKLARFKFRREHTMFFVFVIISIYLPITAAKFFLLGTAGFALLAGEVLLMVLDVAGYGQLRRNVASLADRRSQFTSFRRSIKARHFLVMGLLLLIIIPNVWYAIDAGIPYNTKSGFNTQVYDTLPAPLRTSPANASQFYLGAAGTSLDTPDQYDSASYNWLATQDTNLPPPERPAVISWWDYGFQIVGQGQHPTVADNFQNGIDPAGAFLLSQNESQAIAVLAIELLAANQVTYNAPYFTPAMSATLAQNGVDLNELRNLMVNTSADVPLVINHPERYLPVDAANLDPENAMYMATSWYLADTMSLNDVSHLYNSIMSESGWSIRYALVDTRLFPLSGSNTGIYYAPADLTDRVIGPGGTPTAFFNVTVLGSDGNTYPSGQVPASVSAVSYNINYFSPFYNSMIYRVFAGYNGTDIGQSAGIPGLSGGVGEGTGYYPEPGWMLQHFQAVYITAFYCPHGTTTNCVAMNQPQAEALAAKTNGTAETVQNGGVSSYYNDGDTFLAYYPGQTFLGTVSLPNGAPVPNARVTVYDSFNIPHMTTTTSADGTFSIILPPGNDTVNITTGTFDGLTQAGNTLLKSIPITVDPAIGYSTNAAPLVKTVTIAPASSSGVVYWNQANNTTYIPTTDPIIPGATVNLWGQNLTTRHVVTDASGTYLINNIAPGTYNVSVTYQGFNFSQSAQSLSAGTVANNSLGLSAGGLSGFVTSNVTGEAAGATVTVVRQGGPTVTLVTTSTGAFNTSRLTPGNYTVQASSSTYGLASIPQAFTVGTNGTKITMNLSLLPIVTVRLTVTSGGSPVANFPVRFTPLVGATAGANGTLASPGDAGNATTFLTAANGTIVGTLPADNYSVYALGFQGSGIKVAIGAATLGGASGLVTLPNLALSPAFAVHGFSGPPATGIAPTGIFVTASTASGDQVSAFANISGNWLLMLPAGTYGISATAAAGTSGAPGYAALSAITLSSNIFLNLSLAPATVVATTAGYTVSGQIVTPAPGARITLTEEPLGARFTTTANGQGNATLAVPATLPAGASFCLNVTATGFVPYTSCNLMPPDLANLKTIGLTLETVPTTITLSGIPTAQPVVVNVTASGAPAQSVTLNGYGPTFTANLVPGKYSITAWARSPTGTGVYRGANPLNVTLALGTPERSLALPLYYQVPSRGYLTLPSGLSAAFVTIRLTSSAFQQNLTGTVFTSTFYTAPGNYTLFAAGTASNVTYANLTRVTVSSTGAIGPRVNVASPGGVIEGTLTPPGGAQINTTIPVTLTGASGFSITVSALHGVFSTELPQGMTVYPTLNATVPSVAPGGVTIYTAYTVVPGTSCTQAPNLTTCKVPLVARPLNSTVVGALTFGGQIGDLAGTVTLVGPAPGANATTISFAAGPFTLALPPGVYEVYATSGSGGAMLATVERVTIPFGTAVPLNLTLTGAWTDTLTLTSGASGMAPTASVNFTGPNGAAFTLPSVPVNVPNSFALPPGTWTLSARSTASPYGIVTPTGGNATVGLVAGNAATRISLVPVLTRQVAIALQGPTVANLGPSGVATFSYAVRNTGTTPVTIHLVGSPATWNFTFTPANYTLGIGLGANATASGEVVLRVPAGTAVAHPPVAITAELANGTVVGAASPAPTVNLAPTQGLRMGASPSLGSVAPFEAQLSFWVLNSGNTPESVNLGVSDAARLTTIGWNATIEKSTAPVTGPEPLTAGSNNSFTVRLISARQSAVPPISVTVVAQLTNGTMATASTTLNVTTLPVGIANSTLAITGPSVGTPPAYPDWFLITLGFVPTMAVIVIGLTWRWWRSRRWTRR